MSEEVETKGEVGNEAVTTATIETPEVTAVIEDRVKNADKLVTTGMIVETLKRIETQLRKNYPDPDRIVATGISPHTVIHQDFRRKVEPLPPHVLHPMVALVKGKPLKVSSYTMPPVYDRDDVLVRSAYEVPVYAAAGPDGKPWVDARGNYVVIDPQTGAIRQRMVKAVVKKRRNWFQVRLIRFKQWIKSIRFDFKIIKRK